MMITIYIIVFVSNSNHFQMFIIVFALSRVFSLLLNDISEIYFQSNISLFLSNFICFFVCLFNGLHHVFGLIDYQNALISATSPQ